MSANAADPALVVLVGRPNSGKSSLFNAITGGNAHVGNFPGITVDVLEANVRLPSGAPATVADLPGLYSLEADLDADTDEGVARTFLNDARRAGRRVLMVQVLDTTHLALHLRLTSQLRRLGLPCLLVASQRDVLERGGHVLDEGALRRATELPVVHVSARSPAARADVLGAIERALGSSPPGATSDLDPLDVAEHVVSRKDGARGTGTVALTERLDAVLLHPIVGPITFVALMAALFAAVFLIADPVTSVLDKMVAFARLHIEGALGKSWFSSLVSDGLLAGAGTVLAFLPQIVVLTVVMELLEASGYLARGAFLVDRLLRVMGLSGRSFLPLLMGHACAIPAIGATRIVRDPKERLTTILVLPLMTCSARIPTYALIVSAFFFKASVFAKAAIFVALYFAGLLSGLVASLVLRRSMVRGQSLPLVLEMPTYRMPQAGALLKRAIRASGRFLRDVGTTIVIAAAVLWAVLTVPAPQSWQPHVASSTDVATATAVPPPAAVVEHSLAAAIGRVAEPITKPLGFDWRINVGLIGSFGARELMVGTLGIIFGLEDASDNPAPLTSRIRGEYPARTGLALLAFFVLACQCMSTVAAIRRETRSLKWPAFVLAYTYGAAYVAAAIVYRIAALAGL